MDLFDRDDSLFHEQEHNPLLDNAEELSWQDNVFGERLDREETSGNVDEAELADDTHIDDDLPLAS